MSLKELSNQRCTFWSEKCFVCLVIQHSRSCRHTGVFAVLPDPVHELHSSAANGEHIFHGTGMRPRWGGSGNSWWRSSHTAIHPPQRLDFTPDRPIADIAFTHALLTRMTNNSLFWRNWTETPHDTTMSWMKTAWVTGLSSTPCHEGSAPAH